MRVAGFTFVRNGVKYDYPFIESLRSLLPVCGEVIVAVGQSDDDTLERIESLKSTKIKIIQTVWDDTLRTKGSILAQQTDLALQHVDADWAVYLQADEVLHENDYEAIVKAMEQYKDDVQVEGLLFSYNHFYGSYQYIGDSRRWYRREVRAVKPLPGLRSWGDAQGFRVHDRKLNVKLINASIYHYGWVKPPEIQQLKQKYFNRLWHSDDWVAGHVSPSMEYDYNNGGKLKDFEGTHPKVMFERVSQQHWRYSYNKQQVVRSRKEILLEWIEKRTGKRLGEYRNYRLL